MNNRHKSTTRHVILCCIMLLLLTGCAGIPFPKITTPKKPETVYSWQERIKTKPHAVVYNDKVVIVEETEKTLAVGLQRTIQRLTVAEKLGNWISGLSIVGFLILIVCLILAPGATLGFLVKAFFKWKRALRETVSAIKESKAVDKDTELKKSLKATQSLSTKKLVDTIKRTV